uniref:Uncharacterized protein n=1 Tax=Physcomitrium patens TaxID=3218 RepID=A0A2K1JUI1_PHYPA|nr:hypothetical protein PHYPA_014964 [Physcomitrium patens]
MVFPHPLRWDVIRNKQVIEFLNPRADC